jgi:hypothetical protein
MIVITGSFLPTKMKENTWQANLTVRKALIKHLAKKPLVIMKNVVAETQKGKNKVDGDPSQKSDQPIENE